MSIQPIRLFGDPVLRTPAAPVVDFDAELRRLVQDLTDTMLDAPGAGLAAPQIGVGLRVFTWCVDGEVGHLVNPRLSLSGGDPGRRGGLPVHPRAGLRLHPGRRRRGARLRHARRARRHRGVADPRARHPARDRPPRRHPLRGAPRRGDAQGRDEGDPRVRVVRRPSDDQGEPAPDPRARLLTDTAMRVVFAGTPEVALPSLRAVAASPHELVGVVTRPDAGPAAVAASSPHRWPRPPRSSAYRCSSPSTPATRPSSRLCATWRRTAARSSPTAPCCRRAPWTSRRTAG